MQRWCKNETFQITVKIRFYEQEKSISQKCVHFHQIVVVVLVVCPQPNVDAHMCNPILFIEDMELYLIGRGLSGPGVAIKRPCFNFFHSFIHLRLYQVQKQKSRIVHANKTKNFVQIKSYKMFQWSNESKHFRSCGIQPTWPSVIHVQCIKMSFP